MNHNFPCSPHSNPPPVVWAKLYWVGYMLLYCSFQLAADLLPCGSESAPDL